MLWARRRRGERNLEGGASGTGIDEVLRGWRPTRVCRWEGRRVRTLRYQEAQAAEWFSGLVQSESASVESASLSGVVRPRLVQIVPAPGLCPISGHARLMS